MTNRLIPLTGVSLFVAQVGEGRSTVLVHGFGGDLEGWDALLAHLPADRRYLRYDLRGFGRSAAQDETRAFSHADDLLALLDALSIERCDLVGLSMGGAIALNVALDHPDRVASLALISPGLTAWEWSEEWRALWRPMTEAARAGDMALARRHWRNHPLFAPVRETAGAALLEAEIARYAGAQWVKDHQAAALPDIDRLHGLAVPTLLLSGGRDMEDFRLIAAVIAASAPAVSVVERPDLGHMLPLEDPRWCADQLAGWWDGAGPSLDPA